MFLPFRVIQIFAGFDFTDAVDFGPVITLFIGLLGVCCIYYSPKKKASLPLILPLVLLSLWPLLPNFGLLFMAREFQSVQGAWPQVMVDDPKNLYGGISPQFDALFHLTNYLEAFSGAWMVIFFTLFFAIQSRLSLMQKRVIITLSCFSALTVLFDPGNLYAWWMD